MKNDDIKARLAAVPKGDFTALQAEAEVLSREAGKRLPTLTEFMAGVGTFLSMIGMEGQTLVAASKAIAAFTDEIIRENDAKAAKEVKH